MSADNFNIRAACAGEGQALYDVTHQSVLELGRAFYSPVQLAGWMGDRTSATYETLIANGNVIVALRNGNIVGFVDAEAGEVTRLFVLATAAGSGLGKCLLKLGIEQAQQGFDGDIQVEATLNAVGFYAHHGFKTREPGFSSHTIGGEPIAIVHMVLNKNPTQS